jgi:hypothetical protein
MPDTNKILPRSKPEWLAFARNAILVASMAIAAFTGTAAANETRLDRVESKVERIELQVDRILDKLKESDGTP